MTYRPDDPAVMTPTQRRQEIAAILAKGIPARVTQIMNLLQLAPDIQEAILFLPRTFRGRDPIPEIMVRPIAAEPEWCKQRGLWKCLAFDPQLACEE